jgi:hypothetical protein
MNSPYPEAAAQFTQAADQLPASSPDAAAAANGRAFWTDPYRDGHPVDAERRDRNRVELRPAHDLRCSLGKIIDLSTRGARITRRWAMTPGGDIFTFTLRSGRDELTLRGACVWSRRSGFMQHMAGIALATMTPSEMMLLRAFIDRHASLPVVAAA